LEAFTQLLKHLPADTGMAFVLVQHLDPVHESALTSLLTRVTSIPVREVTNNLPVEVNHIYIIPPNVKMAINGRVLKLSARDKRGPPRSIDFFFESLAQDQRDRAIGVILSGTATDGTMGLQDIKAEGGITFAQDESARYDSMPRSAVAAGCVDFVLSPDKIAQELARIARHPFVVSQPVLGPEADRQAATEGEDNKDTPLPSGGDGTPPIGARQARAEAKSGPATRPEENGFRNILLLLRNHSGVDFSFYKSNTIQRRVTRRVVLNKLNSLDEYAAFLKGNAKELDALYTDVLISVTSFFRNPEAFDALKRKVFPKILHQRRDDPMRVWVVGCSTGQEAYSIAMSFAEFSEDMARIPKLQIFATDLNDALLEKARHGLYAKSLAQDISPERLRRFFVEEDAGYRVSKTIREQVVFARQNVLNDPPFSRMDLISCRNVLIYLEPELQRKVIPAFHYALKPSGFLFLGASEAVGQFIELFEPADKKQKIFSKKPGVTPPVHVSAAKDRQPSPVAGARPPAPTEWRRALPDEFQGEIGAQREADRLSVNRFAPPGVLISSDLKIIQFRGPTGPFLEPPVGKASFDVLKMAREGLMMPLRAAINKVKREHKAVRSESVRIIGRGQPLAVNFEVIPLKNLKQRYYLILFELGGARKAKLDMPAEPPPQARDKRQESRRIGNLELELAETREYLQSIQEQSEASNEELYASNEEVQSTNEELQSINEELETSKEELESSNEELTTVNEEMANRNTELTRLTGDLNNLHLSINTAILLLARDLTIRRFTPQAEGLFNLMATDIGRFLGGIKHNLEFPNLEELVREVIHTVQMQEHEVQSKNGRWYLLRVRPYMTLDNKIDGAVLLLVDIDAIKRSEQEAKTAREQAEDTLRTAPIPLLVLDSDLRVKTGNESFYKTFSVQQSATEGRFVYDLGNGQWNIPKLRELLENILPANHLFEGFEVTHEFEGIGCRTMILNGRRMQSGESEPGRIVLVIEDVTDRKAAEAIQREAAERFRFMAESMPQKIFTAYPGGEVDYLNQQWLAFAGLDAGQAAGWDFSQCIHPDEAEEHSRQWKHSLETGDPFQFECRFRRHDGAYRWHLSRACAMRTETGDILMWIGSNTDIDELKQAQTALAEARDRLASRAGELEQLVAARTDEMVETNKQLEAFVYTIAHDLRAPLRSMEGFSTMLLTEAGTELNERARGFANRINRSARFMDALLKDLLALSSVSQARLQLVPVNLEEVVQAVMEHAAEEIRSKSALVEAVPPWPAVMGHAAMLGQVLTNLVGNAMKFVSPGTQPVVKLHAQERNEFVRIWVEDNGVGIAEEHYQQIFRPFTRLHGEAFSGTGIGLAIVQKGVEQMHGTFGVVSSPEQGSRFWFELRRA
jgi:two-component system CheB/CheR fusion protein